MARPTKCRFVDAQPRVTGFKPSGVPAHELETVALGLDELEALRLADLEALYQDAAAERMGISRATFSRLIQVARQKVASALFDGKVLLFQGGPVAVGTARRFECAACGTRFELACGTGPPGACPGCGSLRVFRMGDERGHGRRRRCGGGWGRMRDGAGGPPGAQRGRGRSAGGFGPPAQSKGD